MNRNFYFHLTLCFLVGFCITFFCYAGLPVDFTADHIWNVRGTNALSYGELWWLILNPFTPAWFYPPHGLMEYLRPLQFVLMKLYFNLFHYSLVPFHVTAAIGHGILAGICFSVIYYWTASFLFGWLAVFLYATFPSNFFNMISTFSMDFHFLFTILSLSALLLFGSMTSGRTSSKRYFGWAVLGWICAIWLSIKLKSSEKIIPIVCFGFLMLRLRSVLANIGASRTTLLICCMIGMTILIVPLRPFEEWIVQSPAQTNINLPTSDKDKTTLSFDWKNLFQRTFFVPGESFALTTVRRKAAPMSFTGNYGFFLGWFFWLCLLLMPFILARIGKKRESKNHDIPTEAYKHYFLLFFTWFFLMIAGFASGLDVHDTRFLNFAYVPSIFLLFMMFGIVERVYFLNQKKRPYFRIAFVSIVTYTVFCNGSALAKLVGHFEGFQQAIVSAEKDVFKSFYGEAPNELTLYQRHQELEEKALIIDWYELSDTWIEDFRKKIEKEKMIYFYTRSEDSERLQKIRNMDYQVSLWKRYNFLDAKPLIFKLFRDISKVRSLLSKRIKKQEILVYKISITS